MEIEQIEKSLAERDEAIRSELTALDEKNSKLEKRIWS
jgi:hypothetical protein